MNVEPIGFFHCSKINPYDAARQSTVDQNSEDGHIKLLPGQNFEQALDQLEKFSHIWLIYNFHLNDNWKPKVNPPRGSKNKVGVFATRSPHRPNSIGISCVQLVKVEGLNVYVKGFDLLDETPILDIKPYLAYADSHPHANMGWIQSDSYSISWSEKAKLQIEFLRSNGVNEIFGFVTNQLSEDPANAKKKRVSEIDSLGGLPSYILAYRTWRIYFHIEDSSCIVNEIKSGYSDSDLQVNDDPYADKKIHQLFRASF